MHQVCPRICLLVSILLYIAASSNYPEYSGDSQQSFTAYPIVRLLTPEGQFGTSAPHSGASGQLLTDPLSDSVSAELFAGQILLISCSQLEALISKADDASIYPNGILCALDGDVPSLIGSKGFNGDVPYNPNGFNLTNRDFDFPIAAVASATMQMILSSEHEGALLDSVMEGVQDIATCNHLSTCLPQGGFNIVSSLDASIIIQAPTDSPMTFYGLTPAAASSAAPCTIAITSFLALRAEEFDIGLALTDTDAYGLTGSRAISKVLDDSSRVYSIGEFGLNASFIGHSSNSTVLDELEGKGISTQLLGLPSLAELHGNGATFTDFEVSLHSLFYGSPSDTLSHLNSSLLCEAASNLTQLIAGYPVVINCSFVDELVECFAANASCALAQRLSLSAQGVPEHYTSVYGYSGPHRFVQLLIKKLLASESIPFEIESVISSGFEYSPFWGSFSFTNTEEPSFVESNWLSLEFSLITLISDASNSFSIAFTCVVFGGLVLGLFWRKFLSASS